MSARINLVDFHCHLDLYPDHEKMISESEEAGIFTLAVTTTPRAWPRNNELVKDKKYVRAALGLHPQLVADYAAEIALWESYLDQTRYVGEVGLDAGPRFYKSFALQKKVFDRVLDCCAEAGGKILTVHSVRSAKAVLDSIESKLPQDRSKVVLHWFTGSKSDFRRASEMGCYFSVNETMLNNQRLLPLIQSLPVERLLTETDGPFTEVDGRPAKPSDVCRALESIGRLHGFSAECAADRIKENLRRLLA